MSYRYDLIVIGGGSGGVASARRAAALGARVALVERDRLGGTCVIRGCVPKKLMMYAGRIGAELREAAPWGWDIRQADFDLGVWQDHKSAEIARLEGIYRGMLDKSGVTVVSGQASIADRHTVMVGSQAYTTERILIATGGSPNRDAFGGIELAMSSNELLDLRVLPKTLGVIGSGYIGLEFACIMQNLGSRVTVFYRDQLPLRGFDHAVRERVAEALQMQGIALVPESQFGRIQAAGDKLALLANQQTYTFDGILNATGRHPNTAGLGLEALGIALAKDRSVPVDGFSQTSVPGVFAIGDVTNRKNLTPVAIAEGRAFADNTYGGQSRVIDHASVATATFIHPPLGSVGLSEEAAQAQGKLRIYEASFRPMKTAFAGGSLKAYMKVIVHDATDRVLGIHMLGEDAPEIIQALAVAYRMGATKADFDATIAVHPTIAEEFMLMREVSRTVG